MDALAKLQALANCWGGRLVKITKEEFRKLESVAEAPFADFLGVDYEAKTVYYTNDDQTGEIIHEMGHVFACRTVPEHSDEWKFFGWEWMVSRRAGCEDAWRKSSRNYNINTQGTEFGDLSPELQKKLLLERVQVARKNGTVAKNGAPMCIRFETPTVVRASR